MQFKKEFTKKETKKEKIKLTFLLNFSLINTHIHTHTKKGCELSAFSFLYDKLMEMIFFRLATQKSHIITTKK